MGIKRFGAICVGSAEQELCIYEIKKGSGLKLIDRVSKLLPIGTESITEGRLSYASVEALCGLLRDFAGIMHAYQVDAYKAYATTAIRDAGNREIVLDQIAVRTGIHLKLIYNSEQRYINYKALAAASREFNDIIQTGTLILDTGHGSLQFSVFDKDALISTENLEIGAARLAAELKGASLTDAQQLDRVQELVDSELLNYKKLYLKGQDLDNLVGIGENVLYRYWRVNAPQLLGKKLAAKDVMNACREVRALPLAVLEERFGGGRAYARLLPIAAIYFSRVIELCGIKNVYFPGVKFCDGIAAEYAEEQKLFKIGHDFVEDIISESRNMAKRYRCNTPHAQSVERLALALFDALKKTAGLTARDRLLLQIAAILHDCGKFISVRNADECGFNIIMSTEIIGLSHAERKLIAAVVRYHKAAFHYKEAALLGAPILTAKLTAILRLASALDHGHGDKLSDQKITVSAKDRTLQITTGFRGDLTLERLALLEETAFFEEIFGLQPELHKKRG